jgi:hypothetical protein
VKPFLKVYHEDIKLYKRYGAKARIYLKRLHISWNLMNNEEFSHDWLTEFEWKELDGQHNLMAGLVEIKHRYDYLKRERTVLVGDNAGEAVADKAIGNQS